ncbi:hypothetical protein L228DRAFT_265692 [Xylona heveae TC161]|uniref:Intracellular protein transport protein n=1 Tax=Xylona heveae (strain CBS 132557 / TC161) TaxID=1328760 RepID=A0A165IPZ0_XYLHT|nr:hypothetical protein L228DRAFT_265692 [Xylona heveae TC161]KZF25213.1 hypothetical protein L228DRAFT_265692 [Xylona heveae TC161]
MFRILESQAPAKQSATETINVLSSRLASASLLEDRRAAILGLRSFAKEYPASVASGALRGLISSLRRDIEDVDTVKIILETLLILFSPNEASPESSDDIALWLADEFTQRQDNITILLNLLETTEFYNRLYTLQLLSAILSARPERTQESILGAPLGISRLVLTLDDRREAIRNEGLLLLVALTPSSSELQKLIAFENTFERLFHLIHLEGLLTQGGIIVQDSLSLLANLLRLNGPNQTLFRESGFVGKAVSLLSEGYDDNVTQGGAENLMTSQREKNTWGLLATLRLLLVPGSSGTKANQFAFWQAGLYFQILRFALDRGVQSTVRSEALLTCADLIRDNFRLQEAFAQYEVTSIFKITSEEQGRDKNNPRMYVIDALLQLILETSSFKIFDVRFAACECIKSYFNGHDLVRLHFLRRAIEGHKSGGDATANVLSTLMKDSVIGQSNDPYRTWFASVLFFHLLFENPEAKDLALRVTEGNESCGEEVITCIQAITGNLISGLQRNEDERVIVGYLMVLCGWMFEDREAVNDFLCEGSSIQSLVQTIARDDQERPIAQGLCAALLGIIYEFSTKDSPIPRRTIQSTLFSRLGREAYVQRLKKLREHQFLRDFEVLSKASGTNSIIGPPDVFFDQTFVDFLKDNFSRLIRALDRDPGFEVVLLTNDGIPRDLVDSLRAELENKSQVLRKLEVQLIENEQRYVREKEEEVRVRSELSNELKRVTATNQHIRNDYEERIRDLAGMSQRATGELERRHAEIVNALEAQMSTKEQETAQIIGTAQREFEDDISRLRQSIRDLTSRIEEEKLHHHTVLEDERRVSAEEISEIAARLRLADARATEAELREQQSQDAARELQAQLDKTEQLLANEVHIRTGIQAEIDDLLIVLADLEEKRAKDKQRLISLGAEISDNEGDSNDSDNNT